MKGTGVLENYVLTCVDEVDQIDITLSRLCYNICIYIAQYTYCDA